MLAHVGTCTQHCEWKTSVGDFKCDCPWPASYESDASIIRRRDIQIAGGQRFTTRKSAPDDYALNGRGHAMIAISTKTVWGMAPAGADRRPVSIPTNGKPVTAADLLPPAALSRRTSSARKAGMRRDCSSLARSMVRVPTSHRIRSDRRGGSGCARVPGGTLGPAHVSSACPD
jgi:hypothetical protein